MYLTYTGLYQKIRLYYFRKVFLAYVKGPEAKILDYGCGPGDALEVCRSLSLSAVGVDPYDYSFKQARERGFQVYKCDYSDLPFPKGMFDIILLQSVIEHLKNPIEVIDALKEYLTRDGVLILSAPTPGPHFWDDPTHVRPFTPKSFVTLADLTGLELVKVNYVFAELLNLTISMPLIYKILNLLPFSLGTNLVGVYKAP